MDSRTTMKSIDVCIGKSSKIVAYQTENDDDIGDLFLTINDTSAFPIDVLSDLQCVMADMGFNSVGLLNILHVDPEHRGTGMGKQLVQSYCDKIAKHTDIDMVFARIENPQATGIDLELFYEKFGFESAFYASGELLMVTKNNAEQIAEAMTGLRAQRTNHYLHRSSNNSSMEP